MSRGPGKWQRLILAILESKVDTTDYRRLNNGRPFRNGSAAQLIERRFPEMWNAHDNTPLENHPLENGWVSISDLRKDCKAESMAAYKALLRALDRLEDADLTQGEYITSPKRIRLVRISVDRW